MEWPVDPLNDRSRACRLNANRLAQKTKTHQKGSNGMNVFVLTGFVFVLMVCQQQPIRRSRPNYNNTVKINVVTYLQRRSYSILFRRIRLRRAHSLSQLQSSCMDSIHLSRSWPLLPEGVPLSATRGRVEWQYSSASGFVWLREVGSNTPISSRMNFPFPMTSLEGGSDTPAVSHTDFPLLVGKLQPYFPLEPTI